jgi:hypothetical protein
MNNEPKSQQAKNAPGQLVNGTQLLEILFTSESRPSLRWLRWQQKEGRIPYLRMGQLVFFDPMAVRGAMEGGQQGART